MRKLKLFKPLNKNKTEKTQKRQHLKIN